MICLIDPLFWLPPIAWALNELQSLGYIFEVVKVKNKQVTAAFIFKSQI